MIYTFCLIAAFASIVYACVTQRRQWMGYAGEAFIAASVAALVYPWFTPEMQYVVYGATPYSSSTVMASGSLLLAVVAYVMQRFFAQ